MNLLTRLLKAIKSLFSKRGNNVEGIENSSEQQPDAGAATVTVADSVVNNAPSAVAGSNSPVADAAAVATVQSVPAATDPVAVNAVSSFASTGKLSNVKTLLKVAGHDVDAVWDDAVAYVQKVAQEESELVEKLVSVLKVAGHDVAGIIGDAFSFASKHGKA